MTHIEASNVVATMKQAQESAQKIYDAIRESIEYYGSDAALRDALDEAFGLNEDLRQAIATEESSATQEPVTWRNAAIRVGEDLCSVGPFGYYDMTAEQWLTWALSVVTVHPQPKAEQEPKREWVGMTDDRVEELIDSLFHFDGTRWSTDTPRAVIQEIIKECE